MALQLLKVLEDFFFDMLRINKYTGLDIDHSKTHDPLKPGGWTFNQQDQRLVFTNGRGDEMILTPTSIQIMCDYLGDKIEVTGEGYIK